MIIVRRPIRVIDFVHIMRCLAMSGYSNMASFRN